MNPRCYVLDVTEVYKDMVSIKLIFSTFTNIFPREIVTCHILPYLIPGEVESITFSSKNNDIYWVFKADVAMSDWDPTVDMHRITRYKNFTKHGVESFFYKSGTIKYSTEYKDGLRHGKYIWLTPLGRTIVEGNYENGLREGVWKHNYENGDAWRDVPYVKGNRHGWISEYTSTPYEPILYRKMYYVEDKQHGPIEEYHLNGRLKERGFGIDNVFTGIVYRYNVDGKLQTAKYSSKYPLGAAICSFFNPIINWVLVRE